MKKQFFNKKHNSLTGNYSVNYARQNGVVLIVALVFLIALTAVAVALMQNSSSDVRMSGATEDKVIATQQAISATDEVIADQISGPAGTNGFTFPLVRFPLNGLENNLSTNIKPNTVASIDVINNTLNLESFCPHSRNASSTNVFRCNVLRTRVIKNYGRKNANGIQTNRVIVNSGIAQQLLK